jgi:hypothetical protein
MFKNLLLRAQHAERVAEDVDVADKTPSIVIEKSLNRKHAYKQCPICKQELISDATKMQACALCGMVLDSQNMVMFIEDGEEKYFCLHGCYEKYFSINETEEVKK